MELRTVVREWHKCMPNHRLKAGYEPEWAANVCPQGAISIED